MTTYKSYIDPLIDTLSVLPGSGMLQTAMPKLGILKGTPAKMVNVSGENQVNLLSSGKCYETVSTGLAIKFYKEHSFFVGGTFYDATPDTLTIASIDTSNALYDTITVVSGVVTGTAGTVYYSEAISATEAGLCVVGDSYEYDEDVSASVRLGITIIVNCTIDLDKMPCFWDTNLDYNGIQTVPVV